VSKKGIERSLGLSLLLLHQSSVLLLESLADTLTVFEELLGASHNTSVLTGGKSIGGKVVDTVRKALFN
jgi:hypothetical protein